MLERANYEGTTHDPTAWSDQQEKKLRTARAESAGEGVTTFQQMGEADGHTRDQCGSFNHPDRAFRVGRWK
ncbi:hypothetical protein R1flu_009339 [Riccia fluitans]|uniref:Uncharacterized protein n=1 Tax=Riccia fluitans TaxID=41844 RepID=A0ABD1Z4U3_9MARC